MSHYDTLGISKSATPEEIKRAYRKLASQHHPDKGGDTAKFQEIEEAYRVLSDPNKRSEYDNPQSQSFRFNTSDFDGMPPEFADIFRNFGFANGPFGQRHQRKNKDLRIEIAVSLLETFTDQRKTISIQTTNGHRETVEVSIPRGITTGTSIRFQGLGDNFFATLPRGDLYVIVVVIPDSRYSIQGLDLVSTMEIDCFQAILGTGVEINTIDAKTFALQIPAGTQPGTTLRIRGEGLYQMNSHIRGNLLVRVSITIPKDLNQQQIELLEKIQSLK